MAEPWEGAGLLTWPKCPEGSYVAKSVVQPFVSTCGLANYTNG